MKKLREYKLLFGICYLLYAVSPINCAVYNTTANGISEDNSYRVYEIFWLKMALDMFSGESDDTEQSSESDDVLVKRRRAVFRAFDFVKLLSVQSHVYEMLHLPASSEDHSVSFVLDNDISHKSIEGYVSAYSGLAPPLFS